VQQNQDTGSLSRGKIPLGQISTEYAANVMRSSFFVLIILAACIAAAAQTTTADSQNAAQLKQAGKITAAAVWQPPADFVTKAHAVCDKGAGPASFPECFMNQIAAAGAPGAAVSFTRLLYKSSDGQVGIMTAIKNFGAVDAAQVFYPLRANDNYGLLLLNGDPPILDVDDLTKLDRAAMEQSPMFQAIKRKFAKTDIWPSDHSGSSPWPRVQPLTGGGTELVVNYLLINGCHACEHVGVARFGWDFDATGKLLHTTFIPTPPPPKLTRPARQPSGQSPPPSGV
jgi:hypothetical protein